jgi:flagellar biosynthetic protein FlhB
VELVKAVAKVSLVGGVAVWVLWSERGELLAMFAQSIQVGLSSAGHMLSFSFFAIVSAMLLIVAVDVPFQLWQYHDKLKMSRQEVKQEGKELEGNPEVKGRIRQLQREAARKRMMAAVPAADVIVTNPTHYAVALAYKSGMGAPKVLAKGNGRSCPQDPRSRPTRVPMIEAAPLARALIAMSISTRRSRRRCMRPSPNCWPMSIS